MRALSFLLSMSVVASTVTPGSAQKLQLYTRKVNAADICGQSAKYRCAQSKRHYSLKRQEIILPKDGSGALNYKYVVGRYYELPFGSPVDLEPCTADSAALVFAPIDEPTQFSFKLHKDVNDGRFAGTDFSTILAAVGVPETARRALALDLQRTVKKIGNSDRNIKGRFWRVQLDQNVTDQIKGSLPASESLQQCGTKLEKGQGALIWSIALAAVDEATFDSNMTTTIKQNFLSKVTAAAPEANIAKLSVEIDKTVKEVVNVKVAPETRVVAWDWLDR